MIDWEHGVLTDKLLCDAAKLIWIKLLGIGLSSSACIKVEQSALANVSDNYFEGLTQLRKLGYLKIKAQSNELLIYANIALSQEVKIPLKGGDFYVCDDEIIKCWAHKYPDASTISVLRSVARWGEANPSKRKTRVGIERHINHFFEQSICHEKENVALRVKSERKPSGIKSCAPRIKQQSIETILQDDLFCQEQVKDKTNDAANRSLDSMRKLIRRN